MKPFSQACENNKHPIYSVLRRWVTGNESILEVGSGSGQHAIFFAQQFPQTTWHCSDLPAHHNGIQLWLSEASLTNIKAPLALDVTKTWPTEIYDAIFSANTLHIMPWANVPHFFKGAASCIKQNGLLFVYGPFNYNGKYTSASNAQFNDWLIQQNPLSSIRDFEKINQLALENRFMLQEDNEMPANNRLLVWRKK